MTNKSRGIFESLRVFVSGMKVLQQLTISERKRLYIVAGIIFFLQAMVMTESVFWKYIVDALPQAQEQGWFTAELTIWLLAMGGLMVTAMLIQHFFKEYLFLKSAIRLENLWPTQALEKLLTLPLAYHEAHNTGESIAKISKGNERSLDIVATLFWEFLPHLFLLVTHFIFLAMIDIRLAACSVVGFIPALFINLRCYVKFAPQWEAWDRLKEESVVTFCQSIINYHAVVSYVAEQKMLLRHKSQREHMAELDIDISYAMQKYFFAIRMILKGTLLGTVVFGVYLLFRDPNFNSVGTLVFLIASGGIVNQAMWYLIHVYSRIMRHLISVHRLQKLLDEPVTVTQPLNAKKPRVCEGEVTFDKVSFSYNGAEHLLFNDVTMRFAQNKTTALVGPSGAGKSTAINLIPRFYDVLSGSVTIDGHDVRSLDLEWLRKNIAIVTQQTEAGIFDITMRENIRFGCPEATEDEIITAAKAAYLYDDILNPDIFPNGFDELVGEMGVKLSGGQRQRVLIARAYLKLLRGARILILDEATSSLDSVAEQAIHNMITNLRNQSDHDVTIIIIAHRFATIEAADYIYVIDNGKVVEEGDHARLEQHNGLFAKLKKLQTLGELRGITV